MQTGEADFQVRDVGHRISRTFQKDGHLDLVDLVYPVDKFGISGPKMSKSNGDNTIFWSWHQFFQVHPSPHLFGRFGTLKVPVGISPVGKTKKHQTRRPPDQGSYVTDAC